MAEDSEEKVGFHRDDLELAADAEALIGYLESVAKRLYARCALLEADGARPDDVEYVSGLSALAALIAFQNVIQAEPCDMRRTLVEDLARRRFRAAPFKNLLLDED